MIRHSTFLAATAFALLPVAAVAEEPTASGLVAAVIRALDPAHPTPHPDPEQTVKDQS